MDVYVGDRVQIVNGGMDVTNGLQAKGGKMYGEGGPLWATVVLIDPEWRTGQRFGLPSTVTKVRCADDGGTVVWQVRPEDIAPNVIRKSQPELVQQEPTVVTEESTTVTKDETSKNPYSAPTEYKSKKVVDENMGTSLYSYAPQYGSSSWGSGGRVSQRTSPLTPIEEIPDQPVPMASHPFRSDIITPKPPSAGGWRPLNDQEKKVTGAVNNLEVDDTAIQVVQFPTAWQDAEKRAAMLNSNPSEVQNGFNFPYPLTHVGKDKNLARPYDFQVIPGDKRYEKMQSLEDLLRDFRASVGLPVHGNNDYARAMKYYMYNRFKVPDLNLAHNKTTTHVFFSRPDLNLLQFGGTGPVSQVLNHTEGALVWRRYPELLKLLTDCARCGDTNNLNMLLSNQVESFEIRDEELSTIEAGKSWNEYTMPYGDGYTGRTGGEFSCNFVETSDYSVINLIKLWITYIDNVGRGAWLPSYNLFGQSRNIQSSHIFTKTLDYAASAYVFKCGGGHGEDILYWSKYYGVFPISTGAGALSWDAGSPIGTVPKLNIRFRYAWKKDLSPVSLLEFNHLTRVTGSPVAESAYDPDVAGSSRPFVGVPFIEIARHEPSLRLGGATLSEPRTTIRMKFMKTDDDMLTDDNLFRASMVNR